MFSRAGSPTRYPAGAATRSARARPLASRARGIVAQSADLASYHLAHFKNAASTAVELGHHDSRVTFAHYRKLVKPKDAEHYWNLKPLPANDSKVVAIA